MRAKSVLLLMLALGCGLIASIGITKVMANRNANSAGDTGEMQTIFVALEDIPTGDLITAEVLRLEEWPADKVPAGALTDIEEVEGRRPKSKVYAGSVLLDDQLLAMGTSGGGGANEIPVGYRVVSVKVTDESGVSNLIRPRDRVDILLHMKRSSGSVAQSVARTILQDIQVFAVNDVFDLEKTDGEETFNAKTVSFLVTPKQAEMVTLARKMGEIQLALRSHEDKGHEDLGGTLAKDLGEGDVSNRDAEELVPARQPGSDNLDGFLGMLNSRGAEQPSHAEVAEPAETWNMQLIEGAQIKDVTLEVMQNSSTKSTPGAAQSSGAQSSGMSFWRLISPLRGTSPDARAATAPAAEDGKAEEDGQPDEKAEQEKGEKEDSGGD